MLCRFLVHIWNEEDLKNKDNVKNEDMLINKDNFKKRRNPHKWRKVLKSRWPKNEDDSQNGDSFKQIKAQNN